MARVVEATASAISNWPSSRFDPHRLRSTLDFMKEILGDQVESVGVSTSLVESPASLVQGAYGMSPSMQRYMEAQAVAMGEDGDAVQGMMGGMNKAKMEVNPGHEIVGKMERLVKAGDRGRAEDYGRTRTQSPRLGRRVQPTT